MKHYMVYVALRFFLIAVSGLAPLYAADKGDGSWHSFVYEKPRTTVDTFFADMGDGRNRVSPERFVRELNTHGGYEFRSIDEARRYFTENVRVGVKPCMWDRTGIPTGVGIMRTNADGTRFDVWQREDKALCEDNEYFVYDGDVPKFSLYCGNVITSNPRIGVIQKEPTFVSTMVCTKRITPSYRSSYVDTSGFDYGGIGVGATRSGALIENECDLVYNEAY